MLCLTRYSLVQKTKSYDVVEKKKKYIYIYKLVLTLRISTCKFHFQQVKVTEISGETFLWLFLLPVFFIYMHLIKRCFNSWIVRELQNNEITSPPNGIFATNTRLNYLYVLHNYDTNRPTEVCVSGCLSVCLSVCL